MITANVFLAIIANTGAFVILQTELHKKKLLFPSAVHFHFQMFFLTRKMFYRLLRDMFSSSMR